MTQIDMLKNFFDFRGLYREIRKKTLDEYPTLEEYLGFIEDLEEDKVKGESVYRFITDPNHDDIFIEFEIGEDNEIAVKDDILEIYFWEDTSYSNEGGSHDGGYEYWFQINLDLENFIGLEVVNQN
jgi:hypothetical protein